MTLHAICMQRGMPQSLVVFAVSINLEAPNFGIMNFFSILTVYMHILESQIMKKKLILKIKIN